MYPFRISKGAREWFTQLRRDGSFKLDFDSFYFCFIAGIAMGRKESLSNEQTAELVAHFPEGYKESGRPLVALLLHNELKDQGLQLDEKKSVHAAIATLVMPEASNFLSAEGVKQFNSYAHGGFNVLLDWFDDKPRSLEDFLRVFKQRLGEAMAQRAE